MTVTRRTLRLKLTTAALVVLFGFEQLAYGAPAAELTGMDSKPGAARLLEDRQITTNASQALASIIQDPSQIDYPLQYVHLKEIYSANGGSPFQPESLHGGRQAGAGDGEGRHGKLIIHIQDAHANYRGQQNLAHALDDLMGRYGIPTVFVEGSSGDVSLHKARQAMPLKTWHKVARRFLLDGAISGEEYLNLTSERPIELLGVENSGLYDESLQIYSRILDQRTKSLRMLKEARRAAGLLKGRQYPRKLLQYEEGKGALSDSPDFGKRFDHLLALSSENQINLSDYPGLTRMKDLREREAGIDFDRANEEQQKLYETLAGSGASEGIKQIAASSPKGLLSPLMRQMSMDRVLELASERRVPIFLYPELMKYSLYLESVSGVRFSELMEECDLLEDAIYQRLLTSPDAGKIRAIDRHIELVDRAYNIRMTDREFRQWTANQGFTPTDSWVAFLNEKLFESDDIEEFIPFEPSFDETTELIREFYSRVSDRDVTFVEHAGRMMAEHHIQAAFLIAGGYHTQHLTKLWREEGTSYIVLSPVIADETDTAKYARLLLAPVVEAKKTRDKKRLVQKEFPRESEDALRQFGTSEIRRDSPKGSGLFDPMPGKVRFDLLYAGAGGSRAVSQDMKTAIRHLFRDGLVRGPTPHGPEDRDEDIRSGSRDSSDPVNTHGAFYAALREGDADKLFRILRDELAGEIRVQYLSDALNRPSPAERRTALEAMARMDRPL